MQPPDYDLNKIKFATDGPTFEKAVALYESGKVTQFEEGIRSYCAIVIGTKPYRVSVEVLKTYANLDPAWTLMKKSEPFFNRRTDSSRPQPPLFTK